MSKPRICKSCHWLQNRAEPCWSCSRWGKGKTDHYIPAEETLKEYLERKEREDMEKEKDIENLSTDELIECYKLCMNDDCEECPGRLEDDCASQLSEAIINRLEQLQQERIDERDRIPQSAMPTAPFNKGANEDAEVVDTSSAPAGHLPLKGKADGNDDTVRRCAEYVAEKHLQEDEIEWLPPVSYWRNICGINARQEKKGVEKYGQHLEENTTLSTVQRIEHTQEELIDALKYLEHLKAVAGDKLTANDYQRMAMRTAGEYDTDYDQLRNAAYGLNGEAGEVIDLLKKHEFQGHDLPDEKLIDECGDVLWYCALLADARGFTMEQVMNRNIDKLRKRYPDGFDKARSINREGAQ